jgi:hypothetical protein
MWLCSSWFRLTFGYDLKAVDQRAIDAAANLPSGSLRLFPAAIRTADTVSVAMKNTSFRNPGSRHHEEAVLLGTLLKAKSPPITRRQFGPRSCLEDAGHHCAEQQA